MPYFFIISLATSKRGTRGWGYLKFRFRATLYQGGFMKKILLILSALLLFAINGLGQTTNSDKSNKPSAVVKDSTKTKSKVRFVVAPRLGYAYQKTNNFHAGLYPTIIFANKKGNVSAGVCIDLFKTGGRGYVIPMLALHTSGKFKESAFGYSLDCRLSKIHPDKETDYVITPELGFVIGIFIFSYGYNYNLDTKNYNFYSPHRLSITVGI